MPKWGVVVYDGPEAHVVWCGSRTEAMQVAAQYAERGMTADVIEAWARCEPGRKAA